MKSESIPVGQYQILNSKPLVLSVPTDLLETERMDIEYYQPHFIEMQNRVNQSGLDLPTLDTLRDPKRVITDGIREHVKTSSGVILIRTQNFGDPTLTLEDCVYVDHDQHSAAKKSAVRSGDLLIAIRGYLGKAVIVTNDVPEANINQHIARISVNPHCADSGYLWAFFTSPTGTTQLERQVTGTVQQGIMLPSLRRLPVPLPPRPVQEYIGAKVRLAERCRLQARELQKDIETLLGQLYYGAPINDFSMQHSFWVGYGELDNPRVDAWHYQPVYRHVVQWCREQNFIPVSSIASLSQKRWSPEQATVSTFHYVEISDVDVSTGLVSSKDISTIDAPSRARKLAQSYNVIVSTVRPERKGIGFITPDADGWVLSTGFSVLKVKTANLAYFLCAILRHDVSTIQLIRWNTGATYPAIEEDVPLSVLIPNPGPELQNKVADNFRKSILLLKSATKLVQEAKTDVEALIEGKLDVEGILAGRVKAPTWEALNFSAA